MPELSQFLAYLARPDVTEMILQTDKVIAVRTADGLRPLTKAPVSYASLVRLLSGGGVGRILPSADVRDAAERIVVGDDAYTFRVSRAGPLIQVRISRAEDAPAQAPRAPSPSPPAPEPEPARAPSPARDRMAASPAAHPHAPRGAGRDTTEDAQRPAPPARHAPAPHLTGELTEEGAAAVREAGETAKRHAWRNGPPETWMQGLLRAARSRPVSDVHVSAGEVPMFRTANRLLSVSSTPLTAHEVERMFEPLLDDRAKAQVAELGYADFAVDLPATGRLRANVCRTRGGLKGCFRLVLDKPATLEQLGLPEALAKVATYHQGLAVISGPSGSGKTSTMAALVDLINRSKPVHILSVEDPIEVVHPRAKAVISQREVGVHTESYQAALKGALREDPDVIAIGELRDRTTVEMALSAAETGHLVIATMSTPSGAKTIDRLIDMFPPEDQQQVRATLAGALKIVVSQRLVPSSDGKRLYAAAELITGSVPLWTLIRDDKLYQLPSLLQRGRGLGIIRIEDSLSDLLAKRYISQRVAEQYADDPRALTLPSAAADGAAADASTQAREGRRR